MTAASDFPKPERFPGVSTRRHLVAGLLLAAFIVIASSASLRAQPAASGTLTGRVFNQVGNGYVANVRVTVPGTSVVATTDESGTFMLYGVPKGEITIHVDYVGFVAPDQKVIVGDGLTRMPDFNLTTAGSATGSGANLVVLEKITVVADTERSAQAIAMNEQRNSPSLKSVVAMDEYPEGSSGNLGEFLKYVPGLAIVYSANAPLDVSVRGLPGNTTTIMMDGAELPSAFPSGTRGSPLFGTPFSNAERIEVTKMPTPDVPAASLGGSINIVSRSGFQQKTRSFTYDLYATFNAMESLSAQPVSLDFLHRSRLGPSFALSYTQPVTRSLSFTLGGGYIYNYLTLLTTAPTYDLVRGVQTTSAITFGQQLQQTTNYNVGIDWKPSERNVIKLSGQSRKRDAVVDNAGFQVIFGSAATGGKDFTQGVPTGSGGVAQTPLTERLVMDTKSANLSHLFTGRLWKVESSYSYSEADTFYGYPPGSFRSGTFRNAGNVIVVGSGIKADPWGLSADVLPTRYTATDRAGVPVNIFDQSQLAVTAAVASRVDYERTNEQLKTMVSRQLETGFPLTLKAGLQFNRLGYRTEGSTINYTVRTNTAGAYGLLDNSYTMSYAGRDIPAVSLVKLYNLFRSNPEYFSVNEAATWQAEVNNYRDFKESISAGFVRVDTKLFGDRLWLVGGVRYERTDDQGFGPRVDPTGSLQKDAKGNLVRTPAGATIPITTDPLQVAKLQYLKGGAHADRNYDGYYPSLNGSLVLNSSLLLRVGYARNVGRPDLSLILPGTTFNAATSNPRTITINNSGLNPWTANNYDVTLESYLFKDGIGSVGVFQKDIKGFFEAWQTQATPELLDLYGINGVEDVDYVVITRRNGSGNTRIRGFEFNYKQKLGFLPDWARGLEVFFNYTRLQLDGSATSDFTGFNPETLAYGVNFTRSRYALRFLMQMQGEVRRTPVAESATTGIPAGTYLWQEAKRRPTLTATYSITRNISLYGTLSDFFGKGYVDRQFRYSESTPTPDYARIQRIIETGMQATIGVKGRF